jgi:hypothetical protein
MRRFSRFNGLTVQGAADLGPEYFWFLSIVERALLLLII